jgi:hypothetical protein
LAGRIGVLGMAGLATVLAFGVRLDVPAVAESPSGEVTRLLLETWRRVVESR